MNTQRVEGHTPPPKLCPFCGRMPLIIGTSKTWVLCETSECAIAGQNIPITIWNRRASIERLEKVNDALVRALKELLEEIDNLQDISYSTSIENYKAEACWESAVESAHSALKLAKEPA